MFISQVIVIGQILYDTNNEVIGIATNDMGIAKDGSKKDTFQRGVELRGRSLSLSLFLSHNRHICNLRGGVASCPFLINYITCCQCMMLSC